MLRRVAVVLALALLGAACRGSSHDPLGATSTTARGSGSTAATAPAAAGPAAVGPNGFRPKPIRWDSCGKMQCGSVTVPLDYSQPHGTTIQLFVTRAPATGKRIGPLFVNPGGPGGSAADFAAALPLYFPDDIAQHFDIVGVEPRGVDGSAPFDCGVDYTKLYSQDPTPDDQAERDALISSAKTFAEGCEQHAGDLLPHVGTRDVARDLDTVRAAMGDAQLSYYGASYGTAIGQEYADLFPHRIRAMVLDGVIDLGPSGLDLATEQAAGFEVALHRFADHCTSTGSCRTKDPIHSLEQVQALAERPGGIPAASADRPAGPGEVNLGVGDALYSEDLWSSLDLGLSKALAGDGSGLVALADSYLGEGDFDVYFAVNCIDYSWPSGDPNAFLAAATAANWVAPHFGEGLVSDYLRCVDWPVKPDPLTPVTAPGAPPILVVSTTGDPATPYQAGVDVAHRLESGVLLTNDGEGHGGVVGGNACITNAFDSYLVDLNTPKDGTVCK